MQWLSLTTASARTIGALAIHLLALSSIFTAAVCGERQRFDNFHVYRVEPKTQQQLKALQLLESQDPDTIIFLNDLMGVDVSVNVIIGPTRIAQFMEILEKVELSFELLEENAQSKLDRSNERIAARNRSPADYNWEAYHELNDTYDWLHWLTEQYPENVHLFVAGESYEGRQILGIRISYPRKGDVRKSIFLEGGMHAREWIGPATVTYIAHQLLTSENRQMRLIAEAYDWYIVPHANPDGFVFTHETNRMWRKTRTPYERCYGADPNRNWDFHWNEVGASNLTCSDTYAGPAPFSEVETRTLSKFIATLEDELILYVSFHSYSQLLLFPYGHTGELPPNYPDLKRVFDTVIHSIAQRYGTKYTGGNIYDAIYPAAGASLDWVYGVLDVPYSFCYELRPPSYAVWYGFMLPAEQIIPTGEETLDSLIEMVKEVGVKRN